ncbi:nucleotide-binding protein [Actinopolymorpha singaporensis]
MSDQQPHDDDMHTDDATSGERPASFDGPHNGSGNGSGSGPRPGAGNASAEPGTGSERAKERQGEQRPESVFDVDPGAYEEHIGVGRPYQRPPRPQADDDSSGSHLGSGYGSGQDEPPSQWFFSSVPSWAQQRRDDYPGGDLGGADAGERSGTSAGHDVARAEPLNDVPADETGGGNGNGNATSTAASGTADPAGAPGSDRPDEVEHAAAGTTGTTDTTDPTDAGVAADSGALADPASSDPATSDPADDTGPGASPQSYTGEAATSAPARGDDAGFSLGFGPISSQPPSRWSPPARSQGGRRSAAEPTGAEPTGTADADPERSPRPAASQERVAQAGSTYEPARSGSAGQAAPAEPNGGARSASPSTPPPSPVARRRGEESLTTNGIGNEGTAVDQAGGQPRHSAAPDRDGNERLTGERTAGERRTGQPRPVEPRAGDHARGGPETGSAATVRGVSRFGRPGRNDTPARGKELVLDVPPLSDDEDEAFIRDLSTQRRRPVPRFGWQGALYRLTRINIGPSRRDRADMDLRERLNRQLRRTRGYCGYIGIASEKGGVGKTTLAALLAAEIAEGRRESVGVADLNPDLGTLPDRLGVRPTHSIRDLLAHVDEIPWRYHVHDFMEKVPEMNVRVLAASTDRKIRHQLSMADVELLAELFAPFFSFAILDNGTHITHEAMLGTLRVAHGMVLVTDNTKDGANLARKTLQFLTDNGFPDMRRRVVLAVVAKETASPVKVRAIERAFAEHVRELVVVPYDPALDGGGKIPFRDPNAVNKMLRPQTREAVRRLAAILIDDLVD